jgi:hypothetical protein
MNYFLLKITIGIFAFAFAMNVFVNGCVASANRVDMPSNAHEQNAAPSGWRKIDADGKFSYYLPPDMRDTGIRGIENLHREYTNGRMHLSFDYEPYGFLSYERRALKFGKNFQEIEMQIDGRKSFLFLHQDSDRKNNRTYNADLYIGDLPHSQVTLRMWVSSRSAQDVETAKAIFQTIKFR